LYLFFETIVSVVGISNLASFATFVHFPLLSETTMPCVFHNGVLLLLVDNLRTAPQRLSIKQITVVTTPNSVQ